MLRKIVLISAITRYLFYNYVTTTYTAAVCQLNTSDKLLNISINRGLKNVQYTAIYKIRF